MCNTGHGSWHCKGLSKGLVVPGSLGAKPCSCQCASRSALTGSTVTLSCLSYRMEITPLFWLLEKLYEMPCGIQCWPVCWWWLGYLLRHSQNWSLRVKCTLSVWQPVPWVSCFSELLKQKWETEPAELPVLFHWVVTEGLQSSPWLSLGSVSHQCL